MSEQNSDKNMEKINKQDEGLISKLYSMIPLTIFEGLMRRDTSRTYETTIDYFLVNWLNIDSTYPDTGKFDYRHWSAIKKLGKFSKDDVDAVESYIEPEDDYIEKFGLVFNELKRTYKEIEGKEFDEDLFLDNLVEALKNTKYFLNTPKAGIQKYNKEAKEQLIKHITFARELFELPHFIKCYISFALYNSVPKDFSINERTIEDLKEFSECCIRRFGTTSQHGIREIIKLATREENPNVIAICEYADVLYYGQVSGVERDINKAYMLYKKAAGLDSSMNSKLHKNAYPQALWSVGQIIFNYDNTRVNLPLPKHEPIIEIEELSRLERIKLAYTRASQALSINSELPSAANLLGQIAQLTDKDEDCNGIEAFKKKKHMKDCTYFFNRAKDGGWIYAYNMLAIEELRQLTNDIKNKERWDEHIANYLMYLHEAATLNEPWAANTLGRAFLEGIKYLNPDNKKIKTIIDSDGVYTIDDNGKKTCHGQIDHFNIIHPLDGQPTVIDSIINPELAFHYFKLGYKSYHIFNDRHCGWACANLKCYFSEWLSEEEMNDIDSVLESIKEKYSGIDEIMVIANEKKQLPETKKIKHGR